MAEEVKRPQSPSLTHATPGTNRGHPRKRVITGPGHADHEAITDIAEKVRTKVASFMRGPQSWSYPPQMRTLGLRKRDHPCTQEEESQILLL